MTSGIRPIDMLVIDDVFDMGSGFVLTFSDRTFAEFFAIEMKIDIDNQRYFERGGSKAKRLRYFLSIAEPGVAAMCLEKLWEYREAHRAAARTDDKSINARERLFLIIDRLNGGKSSPPNAAAAPATANKKVSSETVAKLKADLHALNSLEPQARGYAFEKFLKQLFDAYGLEAREAFKRHGDQIDGSFLLAGEIYLLEAKWLNTQCSIGDLHGFHGKVEQGAAWTRGLFVSYSGFTDQGLAAWGRGKRVICMDGRDLYEALLRELPLNQVLDKKVRVAGETGNSFARIGDLFPG